ncbi:MAG TPA: transglycosylase family protein [Dermatophilaceae bacterium]|nr:transglycosylase family protein [Dermatophilaceae bacterium]HMT90655.1 transglycosylase family protein [Dermatophilaceae bacterium]
MFSTVRRRVAAAGVATVFAATGLMVASIDKAVALSVEGQQSEMHVMGSTVADALSAAGITVGAKDLVVPAADQPISDGTQITVRYGRKLTVTADGTSTDYWTTASTVDEALAALGIRTPDNAQLSVSRSQVLGRDGLALTVVTPHSVTVTVDGASRTEATHAATVGDLLTALGVTVGANDRVSPAVDTAVTEGLAVAVKRVQTKSTTATEKVAFATVKKDDATLDKGKTKVQTPGVAGERVVTYTETWVDGVLEGKTASDTKVTKPATDKVVLVGTKAVAAAAAAPAAPKAPISAGNTSGAGINLANAAMWDRIAKCESGGRWNINTGNGYYGGLQFNYTTWLSVGGADFAPRADLASREEQITVANRLYAKRGLQPWGCRWAA